MRKTHVKSHILYLQRPSFEINLGLTIKKQHFGPQCHSFISTGHLHPLCHERYRGNYHLIKASAFEVILDIKWHQIG